MAGCWPTSEDPFDIVFAEEIEVASAERSADPNPEWERRSTEIESCMIRGGFDPAGSDAIFGPEPENPWLDRVREIARYALAHDDSYSGTDPSLLSDDDFDWIARTISHAEVLPDADFATDVPVIGSMDEQSGAKLAVLQPEEIAAATAAFACSANAADPREIVANDDEVFIRKFAVENREKLEAHIAEYNTDE